MKNQKNIKIYVINQFFYRKWKFLYFMLDGVAIVEN